MREELITSGKALPGIDPYLNVWHWHIPLYLFLGGLAAGLLFFAALYTIMDKEKENATAVKFAPILAPLALVIGLGALFLDLRHQQYFWRLYTAFRRESPMSWGAWILIGATPLAFVWVASYLKEIVPAFDWKSKGIIGFFRKYIFKEITDTPEQNWDWRYGWLRSFERFFIKNRKGAAWVQLAFAIILGVYTGILLSAFNARPLWNTSILGPLFLISGLSTAAAAVFWMSNDPVERKLFNKIDLVLIVAELFFITHLFMGFLASSSVQVESANLFLGGEFTTYFWIFIVGLGLIIPGILEILELKGLHIPVTIPAILILVGGILFRFVMVEAGQLTRYLY